MKDCEEVFVMVNGEIEKFNKVFCEVKNRIFELDVCVKDLEGEV